MEGVTPATVTSGRYARAARLASAWYTGARSSMTPSAILARKDSTHPATPGNMPAGLVHDAVNIIRFYFLAFLFQYRYVK